MDFINGADLQACEALREDNTVLVLQDGKFRRMPLSDVLDYLAGAQVTTDTTLLLPDIPADAKATGEAIRRAAPRNLLDNSDFLHPVNQREQNVYTGVCYTIDRWRTLDENAEIKLVESGVSVSGGVLSQYLDKGAVVDWRSYTIACEDADGTLHVKSGVLSDGILGDIMSFSVDGNGTPFVQLTKDHTYVWIAVYEGDYTRNTLPKYESKGMAEELRVCQYYFERVYVHAVSVSAAAIYKQLRFATKRITPTISWYKSRSDNLENEDLGNWNISRNDSNGQFGSVVDTDKTAYWYGYADVDANL